MLKEDGLQELLTQLQNTNISKEEMLRLSALKKQIFSVLLDNQTRQHQEWVKSILQLIEAISLVSRVMELENIALLVTGHMMKLTDAEGSAYLQWKSNKQKFIPQAACGSLQEIYESSLEKSLSTCTHSQLNRITQNKQFFELYRHDPDLTSQERGCLITLKATDLLVLPVFNDDELVGIVQVVNPTNTENFSKLQIVLARLLTNYASIAISRAQMYEEAQQRLKELDTLRSASIMLTSSLDLHKVLATILAFTLEVVDSANTTRIFLYENGSLKFGSSLWADGSKGKIRSQPRRDGLTHTTARRGELIYVRNVKTHPLFENAPEFWRGSIIGLPLKIGEQVVGVMTVAHPETQAFSKHEIRFLQLLGDQAAIAIENARLHNLVHQQAHTDILTTLPNRRALRKHFEEELHRSQRYQHEFSLVMIDLDDFKLINDNYGHPTGDHFLQELSTHMKTIIRNTDFLVRYGGDEFALLLPETNAKAAKHIVTRLQHAVEAFKMDFGQQEDLSVTFSFGCATYPQDGDTLQALIDTADQKLYSQKEKA